MKRKGELFKLLLFRFFSFENYLYILSKFYFISFSLGMLKKNKLYEYPYFLKNIIKEKDVVIDIGANLGYLTRLFAGLVKKEGLVYAIEPVLPVLNVLKRNTRRLKNVVILPFALGAANRPVVLGNNSMLTKKFVASGSNFILDENITADTRATLEFKASMRRGSELFKDLTRLDFIKIDVEGYEVVIVEDMLPLILKFRPLMLIESRRVKRSRMLLILKENYFTPLVLHGNWLYPTDADEYWDMLVIPNEKLESYKRFIKNYQPVEVPSLKDTSETTISAG